MYLNSKVADKIAASTASFVASLQEAIDKSRLKRITLYTEVKSDPSMLQSQYGLGLSVTAAPPQPAPGKYEARGSGNKISWACNGHTFNATSDDFYVKGVNCPCVVIVLPDGTCWVDYNTTL